MTDGLGAGAYLAGSASVIAVVGLLGWGAWRLRRALLPEWSGAPARLAEAVMALAVPIALAQVLGSFGAFRRFPMLAACLAAGLVMGLVGGRLRGQPGAAPRPPGPGVRREEMVAVVVAGAVVAAQWVAHVAVAYGQGMTHPDTLWYHAPYAAHFVQSGSLTGLPDRTDVIQAYYPLDSSLLHALVALPFRTDLLSPLVNMGWATLTLVAAWCVGRRRGVAPLCLLGAVTVLALPMLAGTQPGQASNDVASSGLLLAAVALLLEEDALSPVPLALAGVAAGLAVATKLTLLAPIAVLTLGVVFLALRARRWVSATACFVAVALFGSYWYVRNWVEAGNPLPWFRLQLGPLSFPRRVVDKGDTIAQHLGDGLSWFRFLAFPGLTQALGRAWPFVLAIAAGSIVYALVGRSSAMQRAIAVAVAAGTIAYLFTPGSGGLNFSFNVRYLMPLLLVGFVLLPLHLEPFGLLWRRLAALVMVGLVALNATAREVERVPTWPPGKVWLAVLIGFAVVGVAALVWWGRRQPVAPRLLAVAGLALAVVIVVVGWPLQRHYLERRYVRSQLPIDGVDTYFRGVRDADVVVFGTLETYPIDGLDLSNRVTVGQGPTTKRSADPCRQWPEIVSGKYRYVVFAVLPEGKSVILPVTPPERWFSDDPAATAVLRDGKSVVYRVDGPLHPEECSKPTH